MQVYISLWQILHYLKDCLATLIRGDSIANLSLRSNQLVARCEPMLATRRLTQINPCRRNLCELLFYIDSVQIANEQERQMTERHMLDIIHDQNPVILTPDKSVKEACELMRARRIGAAGVAYLYRHASATLGRRDRAAQARSHSLGGVGRG